MQSLAQALAVGADTRGTQNAVIHTTGSAAKSV